jgi:chemotaxis family two-component system response regulator Rcp1
MSSRTKVSPKIRDWVPRGFYIDDKTWDVRLLEDLGVADKVVEEIMTPRPLGAARDAASTMTSPRGQEKHSRWGKRLGRPLRILLVEDNPGDVRLVQEALQEGNLSNMLSVLENGVEALNFLRRQGKYSSAPRPDLILLDLNLPLKDGREVLREIKQDADLRRIPVVVLTTSQAEYDVLKAYDMQANCYVRKPMDLEQFMTVIQLLQAFWCQIARLPPENNVPPAEATHANP